MRLKQKFLNGLLLSMFLTAPVFAQDLQTAIERTSNAYAVETLERAKTVRLEYDVRLPFESHEYSTDFHDLARQRFHNIFDIKNERGSREFLTEISRTSYHGRYLLKDGKSIFIAYGPDTYQDNGETDFFTQFGGVFRGSDVLLALWMARPESNPRYIEETMWLGLIHDIVEIDFPNSTPLKLFVRQDDGAVTKMERTLADDRELYYTFHNHKKSGDILIAQEHSFYIGDERIYFSFNRGVDLNDRKDRRAFEMDDDIIPEPERTDQSEMAVRLVGQDNDQDSDQNSDLGQRVHQVCQGENCTTFMVNGNSVIGFGMAEGLAERLEAYRQDTGTAYPLQYVIAADHHDEDIGGAQDAAKAGAKLLVTEHTAAKLKQGSEEYDLEIITKAKNFGDLTVMPLGTGHAETVLVAYHNRQKLFMQTGHYYSSFIDGPSYARYTATSLYEAIPDKIRTEAVAILSGQDMKAEKWSDFVSAIETDEYVRCHRNRPICK